MLKVNTLVKQNTKFTTATLGCFLRMPLTSHNLAYASLIAKSQMNATIYFRTVREQQRELSKLYDLQFEVTPQLFGKQIIISYVANFLEPTEVLDPEYTYEKIVDILEKLIHCPDVFNSDLLELTKKQLLSDYNELMQQPSNYAIERFFKLWYKHQPDYAENFMGPIEEIKEATIASAQKFVKAMQKMPSSVICIARDSKQMEKLIKDNFKQVGVLEEFMTNDFSIPAEKLDIDQVDNYGNLQAQLMMGYGYREKLDYKKQICGMVLSQYLAGDQSSKLFTKIREELGAAYDVEANNYANNCLFLINAGLDPDQVDKAKAIIKHEVNQVATGKINLDLLKKAKKSLLNTQLIGQDQENWQLAQMLRDQLFPEYQDFDREKAIKHVTAKQLEKFAQNLFFNESYVLK